MAKVNKTNDSLFGENVEQGNTDPLLVGIQACTSTIEVNVVVPQIVWN